MRRGRDLVLALLLAGCATGPQQVPPEAERIRDFVTRASAAYGKPPLYIVIVDVNQGGTIAYTFGEIRVARSFLASTDPEPLLAHEVGHYVLGHNNLFTIEPGREIAANAEAVRILTKLNGGDEQIAFRRIYNWLSQLHRSGRQARGHLTPCVEINALLDAFPAQRSTFKRCEL